MQTIRGIYLDLEDSTFFYRVYKYKFYFSSQFYRGNFIKKLEDFTKNEKLKLEMRYNTVVIDLTFFAFVLYNRIEKRGFRVEVYTDDNKLQDTITSMPFLEIKIV